MPKNANKAAVKKSAANKKSAGRTTSKKAASKKAAPQKTASSKKTATEKKTAAKASNGAAKPEEVKKSAFVQKQESKLLELRDAMLDSMIGVARDNLRSRAEGNEASAFGMHQADAGSDSYDRDFALNLLSQEQDALYEIDEALKRISEGTYGTCEMSGKKIPHARLEAIPFARYTVECQTQIENENRNSRVRRPVGSLFGLTDAEERSSDDDSNE